MDIVSIISDEESYRAGGNVLKGQIIFSKARKATRLA